MSARASGIHRAGAARVGWLTVLLAGATTVWSSAGLAAEALPAGRGFFYRNDRVPEVPWSIHLVSVDRTNTEYQVHTCFGTGKQVALIPLPDQVRLMPPELGRPVAAINGDYYRDRRPYFGAPQGIQIANGELITGPTDRTCFWIDAAGTPHITNVLARFSVVWPSGETSSIGLNEIRTPADAVLYTPAIGDTTQTYGGRELILERNGTNTWLPLRANATLAARVLEIHNRGNLPLSRGAHLILSLGPEFLKHLPTVTTGSVLKIVTDTVPHLGGARIAIGGGPALLRDGKKTSWQASNVRHPRAVVGFTAQHILMMVVDGRQGRLSLGMTFDEMADYLARLGCTDAMNLDGGGSATCWVLGQVANSPSEGMARGIGNGLVVVKRPKTN